MSTLCTFCNTREVAQVHMQQQAEKAKTITTVTTDLAPSRTTIEKPATEATIIVATAQKSNPRPRIKSLGS